MANPAPANQVERLEDLGKGKEGEIRRWLMELQLARKGHYKRWLKRYKMIVKRYRDEAKSSEGATDEDEVSIRTGYNLLWANIRTTGPAIYSRPPKVIVERRHKDESIVARAACVILQRALGYQMRAKNDQFHRAMKAARLDFQLGGWCEIKARYKRVSGDAYAKKDGDRVEYSDLSTPVRPAPPDGIKPWENVVDEEICFDLVQAEDFLCTAARTWDEVHWVAFRTHMTRDQVKGQPLFGDDARRNHLITELPFTSKPDGMADADADKPENGVLMRCPIWAIWDKTSRKIVYLCEGYGEEVIATVDDPSSLEDFFPVPPPAVGTRTNNTVWPVPDYIEYGAQAREVDELTIRADAVLESVRVAGCYDAAHDELKTLLDGGYQNKLLPVSKWGQFTEKGGLEGAVDFLPIEDYAKVLEILVNARMVAKADADQMSGVFDVMRGSADPKEKLGTQKLKAGYGEQRANEPKDELAGFARNSLAIAAEMIAEHFSPASLWQMSDFGNWWKGQERGLKAKAQRPPQIPANDVGAIPGALGGLPGLPAPTMPQTPSAYGPTAPGPMPAMSGPAPGAPIPSGGGIGAPPSPPAAPPMPAPAGAPPGLPSGPMPGSGAPAPMPPLPSAEEIFTAAVELLKNEKLRGFQITVETDSTIEPDAAMEQQRRTQFLESTTVFMEKALLLGAQLPEAVPLISQMLLFAVRGFGASRELETAFEIFLDRMQEKAANPPPKQPSPDEIKAQSEKAKMEADAAAAQRQQEFEMAKMQLEMQLQREKHQLDMEKMQMELQVMQQKLQLMAEEGRMKLELQQQTNAMKVQGEQQKMQMQERSMVRQDAMEERSMARQDEAEESSMARQEQHETKMMETKEKQAAQPKPSGGQK